MRRSFIWNSSFWCYFCVVVIYELQKMRTPKSSNSLFKFSEQSQLSHHLDVMYRVCDLGLGSNFGVRLAAGKKCYLRIAVYKMRVFTVFREKHLQGCNWSGTTVRLRSAVKIQKLKYKVKSLKCESLKCKSCL